jgi:hypothetical protein
MDAATRRSYGFRSSTDPVGRLPREADMASNQDIPRSDEDDELDRVPTDREAADARWLLSLPDDERRNLMDLADARTHRRG